MMVDFYTGNSEGDFDDPNWLPEKEMFGEDILLPTPDLIVCRTPGQKQRLRDFARLVLHTFEPTFSPDYQCVEALVGDNYSDKNKVTWTARLLGSLLSRGYGIAVSHPQIYDDLLKQDEIDNLYLRDYELHAGKQYAQLVRPYFNTSLPSSLTSDEVYLCDSAIDVANVFSDERWAVMVTGSDATYLLPPRAEGDQRKQFEYDITSDKNNIFILHAVQRNSEHLNW